MVELWTLTPSIVVRIHSPDPYHFTILRQEYSRQHHSPKFYRTKYTAVISDKPLKII